MSISDLTGIEDFLDLQILHCYSNQLTSIDVSNNLDLNHLNCNTNNITSLNLTSNANLNYLACGSNLMTSLDLSKVTSPSSSRCTSCSVGYVPARMCSRDFGSTASSVVGSAPHDTAVPTMTFLSVDHSLLTWHLGELMGCFLKPYAYP